MFSVLVLTAAFQVLLFGLGAWVMRYIQFTTFAALLASGIAADISHGVYLDSMGCRYRIVRRAIWVTPAIVVAGALITWDAYRRWMRTELG